MFLPQKLQKVILNTDYSSNYSSLSKKYIKFTLKCKKGVKSQKTELDMDLKHDQNSLNTELSEQNPPNTLQKSEILKWLFSLSKTDRMKAVAIENKWFAMVLSQMYTSQKNSQNLRFKLKSETTDEMLPPFNGNALAANYNIYSNFNPLLNFDYYFKMESDDFYTFNNRFFRSNVSSYEASVMEKLQIVCLKENGDAIMLGFGLLDDENLFKMTFDSLTEHKFLLYNISVNIDQSDPKLFNWTLPAWFDVKNFYTPAKIYAAFLDQTLVIRYNLYVQEKRKENFKFSLMQTGLDEIFNNRETLINFMNKNTKKNSKEKLFEKIKLNEIIIEVFKDEELKNNYSYHRYSNTHNYPLLGVYLYGWNYKHFSTPSYYIDPINEYYSKIKDAYIEFSATEFIDFLLFYGMNKDNSYDYTIKEKVFNTIYNLFTEKNAEELLQSENQKNETGKRKMLKKITMNNEKSRNSSSSSTNSYSKELDNFNINNNIFTNKNRVKGFRATFGDIKKGITKLLIESNLQEAEKDKQLGLELKKNKFSSEIKNDNELPEKNEVMNQNNINTDTGKDKKENTKQQTICYILDHNDIELGLIKDYSKPESTFETEQDEQKKKMEETKEKDKINNASDDKINFLFKDLVINENNSKKTKKEAEPEVAKENDLFKDLIINDKNTKEKKGYYLLDELNSNDIQISDIDVTKLSNSKTTKVFNNDKHKYTSKDKIYNNNNEDSIDEQNNLEIYSNNYNNTNNSNKEITNKNEDENSEYINGFVKNIINDIISKLEENEQKKNNEAIQPNIVLEIHSSSTKAKIKRKNKKKSKPNTNIINQKNFKESDQIKIQSSSCEKAKENNHIKQKNFIELNQINITVDSNPNNEIKVDNDKRKQKSTISDMLDKLDSQKAEKANKASVQLSNLTSLTNFNNVTNEKEGQTVHSPPTNSNKVKEIHEFNKQYINKRLNDYCNKTTSDDSVNKSIHELKPNEEGKLSLNRLIDDKPNNNINIKLINKSNKEYSSESEKKQNELINLTNCEKEKTESINTETNQPSKNLILKVEEINNFNTTDTNNLKNKTETKISITGTESFKVSPKKKESIKNNRQQTQNLNLTKGKNTPSSLNNSNTAHTTNLTHNTKHHGGCIGLSNKKGTPQTTKNADSPFTNTYNTTIFDKTKKQKYNNNTTKGNKDGDSTNKSYYNDKKGDTGSNKINKNFPIDCTNNNKSLPNTTNVNNNNFQNTTNSSSPSEVKGNSKFRNLNNEFQAVNNVNNNHIYNNPNNMNNNVKSGMTGVYGASDGGTIPVNNYIIINSNININNVNNYQQLNTNKYIAINPSYSNCFSNNQGGMIYQGPNHHQTQSPIYMNNMNDYSNNNNFYYPSMMHINSPIKNRNLIHYNMNSMNYNFYNNDIQNNIGMNQNISNKSCSIPNIDYNNYYMYNNNYNHNVNLNAEKISPSPQPLQKIDKNIHPFTFHFKLHNDILNYTEKVQRIVNKLKEIKISIISKLEKIIKNSFKDENIVLDVYGSFATNLAIESSDIDFTIKFNNVIDVDIVIDHLSINLNKLNIIENVNPICTASVPVIKLIIDPLKFLDDKAEIEAYTNFRESSLYKNYDFDKEDLDRIKVDISFVDSTSVKSNQKASIDYVINAMAMHPEIVSLILILKRFLQIHNLNSSFNGGLSSYSIFIMVLAYIRYYKIQNKPVLGRMLFEFFEYFGKSIKYNSTIIDSNSMITIRLVSNETYDSFPIILDPTNCNHNVAKQSFRIEEVKMLFSNAHDYLTKLKMSFDKKELNQVSNSVFDLLFSRLNI